MIAEEKGEIKAALYGTPGVLVAEGKGEVDVEVGDGLDGTRCTMALNVRYISNPYFQPSENHYTIYVQNSGISRFSNMFASTFQ